ncbi:hypothetical protein D9757_002248 [Collybiopsis confluens]|uniref:Uncharacterized protein n=1 Tax=Collybiopsis confluens TaxID=2823264 RepID=A0A8H5HZH4_9AGAR|nr:hypothetical protein D9757_002248 [Collybiopsis confluens]
MEGQFRRTKPLRVPSLPPFPPSRHTLRSSKSAHNLGHRSAPPAYATNAPPPLVDHSLPRLLSAEDVLGELFRKEDALHSLRILAQAGTGVMDSLEESYILQEPPVSPLNSRSASRQSFQSRTSARSRSTLAGDRVGMSFLRMALEDDEDEDDEDRRQGKGYHHLEKLSSFRSSRTTSRASTEDSLMSLDGEHSRTSQHPYSEGGSVKSVKSTVSRSALQYGLSSAAVRAVGGESYGSSTTSKMGSRATQGYEDDDIPRPNQLRQRRQQLPDIALIRTEIIHDALPQLPKLIPPSPLSASFDRTLSLSGYPSSGSSVQAGEPSTPVTSCLEEFSFRQERASLVTVCSDSEESCGSSRRPGSISTLAFGKVGSIRRKSGESSTREISFVFDSEKDASSSNHGFDLNGYEGDYNSASAEDWTDGEVDFAKYYQRRVSEDLHHVHHTYRAEKRTRLSRKERRQQQMESSHGKEARSGPTAGPLAVETHLTTTATTTTQDEAISTSLSAFQFVDQDPEDEARISISSTVYSKFYYDPYDVLPTPRTPETFAHSQTQRRPEPTLTMHRDRAKYSELQDQMSFMELTSPTKPPIPTSPKPSFERFTRTAKSGRSLERRTPPRDREQGLAKAAPAPRSNSYDDTLDMLPPPTSNNLDPLSRADLVRKSRKLAQVFGQTPHGSSLVAPLSISASDIGPSPSSFLDITSPTTSRHRASNSIAAFRKSAVLESKDRIKGNIERIKSKAIWPPPPSTQYISAASSRRHSIPLTPDEFEFLSELHRREPAPSERGETSVLDLDSGDNIEIGSVKSDRASFIDWDDDSPKVDVKGKNIHPVELISQSPQSSMSSRHSSLSSLTFAPPSAYPGGVPRNSFQPQEDSGIPATPFDSEDEGRNYNRHLQEQKQKLLARQPSLVSIFTPSLMSPEERAEAEKRRKREKLAKLHRFLGSRVPQGLVLGEDDESESGLPNLSVSSMGEETDMDGSGEEKRSWKKGMAKVTRRRSGSESGISSEWSDITDRRKEDLGANERLRMVKRAMRLEKMFGVAPPQTLYQLRAQGHVPHSQSISSISPAEAPKMARSSSAGAIEGLSSAPPNKSQIPTSRELLLPKDDNANEQSGGAAVEVDEMATSSTGPVIVGRPRGASLVYTHYEHSLNSLGDILDRDDRASLKELHEIFYPLDEPGTSQETDADVCADSDPPEYTSAYAGSIRSERRRSLPARTSMASLASLGSITSKISVNEAEGSGIDGNFQVRRRRAAKLTQFFGVDYRDLVQDVLESIESGVELERGRGRIDTEEAEDLLRKLRTIKGKRTGVLQ